MRPQTLSEWKQYWESLSTDQLFWQLTRANTQSFVEALQAEQYSMGDIEHLLQLGVRCLQTQGSRIPSGGLYNLMQMLVRPT